MTNLSIGKRMKSQGFSTSLFVCAQEIIKETLLAGQLVAANTHGLRIRPFQSHSWPLARSLVISFVCFVIFVFVFSVTYGEPCHQCHPMSSTPLSAHDHYWCSRLPGYGRRGSALAEIAA